MQLLLLLDKPGAVKNVLFNKDRDQIEWSMPPDGGSPVHGYLVSYRDPKNQTWFKVREKGATTVCFFANPFRGFVYRIVAENDAGCGMPSDVFIPDGKPFVWWCVFCIEVMDFIISNLVLDVQVIDIKSETSSDDDATTVHEGYEFVHRQGKIFITHC